MSGFTLAMIASAASAEELSLNDLSRYLNSLTTAEATFVQTNADGSTSAGKLFLRRPGRARFEYAPPQKSLVMAGTGVVAIFDSKSNEPPEQYPLRRTPLNLILAENIDLGRAAMVAGLRYDGSTTRVLVQDAKNPEYGTIELVFTSGPTVLAQWTITDDQGNRTRVDLHDLRTGMELPSRLFDISAEQASRAP